jgi:hypothetical protein
LDGNGRRLTFVEHARSRGWVCPKLSEEEVLELDERLLQGPPRLIF